MTFFNKKCYNVNKEGSVTLISVLILGSVALTITVSTLMLGLGTSRSSYAYIESVQAQSLALACAEDALQEIRNSTGFSGIGLLNLTYGDCDYEVVSTGGENRVITSSGTVGTIVRKVQIEINSINPSISVVSWQEVDNY